MGKGIFRRFISLREILDYTPAIWDVINKKNPIFLTKVEIL